MVAVAEAATVMAEGVAGPRVEATWAYDSANAAVGGVLGWLEERVAQLTESLRRQPGIDAMVSVPASELDDCEDVAVLRKALRAKEVQLAKAEDGLKKDEEMIGTLGVQLQELAWTNSKLQEELAACRSGQDRPWGPSGCP